MYAVVQKQGLIILKIKCLIQNPINIYTFCIVAAILWFLPDRQSFHMYLSIQLVSHIVFCGINYYDGFKLTDEQNAYFLPFLMVYSELHSS
jgi:hypothetical protein